MVGFEPTNTGATTQGLNHLTKLNYPAAYGGRNRARTYDPLLVRQVLSQLSYAPSLVAATGLEPVTFRV